VLVELILEMNEAMLIGIDRQVFKSGESYKIDYSMYVLFARLKLTLIYN